MRQAPRSRHNSSGDPPPRRGRPVQDLNFGASLPTSSSGKSSTSSYRKEALFGFVISVKDTFGFIQPYLGEENLYFSERDAPRDIREGDEVSYLRKVGPRGAYAQQVRVLPPSDATEAVPLKGILLSEADPYKDVPGTIEISAPLSAELCNAPAGSAATLLVPYLQKHVDSSKRVIRGDEVAVDVFTLPLGSGSVVVRATRVTLLRSRKELMIAEQVKAFQAGGVQMERGLIESIREGGGSEYGFLKAETRADHVYFRCDDIIDAEGKIPNEMDEVEFYVIAEHVKGKLSNRAVCLRYLPHGTVQFEDTLGTSVCGVVVQEPKASSSSTRASANNSEIPGLMKLKNPLSKGEKTVNIVELWSRCIPEGFPELRIGDEVSADITYYRPEKIFFARNLTLTSFRTLARDAGVVVKVKEAAGFGFIRSAIRDIDVYFRLSDVSAVDATKFLSDGDVKVGMHVSFDVTVDDSSSSSYSGRVAASSAPIRLKAVRIKSEPAAYDRCCLWKSNVFGTVEREVKRDGTNSTTAGLISVNADEVMSSIESADLTGTILDATNGSTIAALQELFGTADDESIPSDKLSSIVLPLLTQRQVQAIEHIAKKHLRGSVSVKVLESHQVESGGSSSLSAGASGVAMLTTLKITRCTSSSASDRPKANASPAPAVQSSEQLTFSRDAVSDIFGCVRKGGNVRCDVFIDSLTHSLLARNVRYDVKEELAEVVVELCRGVVDTATGAGGYIRVIPTDEKLPWFVGALAEGPEVNKELVPGSVVEAKVQTRAGIRYASSISIQQSAKKDDKITLDGLCTAVVAEGSRAVLLDASDCPLLSDKYVNLLDAVRQCSDGKTIPTIIDPLVSDEKVYLPKMYYGRAIPLSAATGIEVAHLVPGAVIRCQAKVCWETDRGPVECTAVEILQAPASNTRLVGTIQNFRIRGGREIELAELLTVSSATDASNTNDSSVTRYYCDVKSLRENNANESLRIGDTVNFLAVPDLRVAVLPVFVGRGGAAAGSLPKRSPLNAMLKQTINSRGYKGITMAQGPPSDSAIGFEKGWKQSLPDISQLEWKALVPHLLESN